MPELIPAAPGTPAMCASCFNNGTAWDEHQCNGHSCMCFCRFDFDEEAEDA